MLECRSLSFSYDRKSRVLEDISFTFEPGKFYGIYGPNGSGKSTFLKLLTGELKAASGELSPLWKNSSERAEKIAIVEQLIPHSLPMSVEEVAALGGYMQQKRRSFDREKLQKVLEELELLEMRKRPFNTLSGGERQRVMLARALVQDTPILCLDEPGSSLDIGFQHTLNKTLQSLAQKGKCVIMISHDLFAAPSYLDRMLLLEKGQLVLSGSPDMVKDSPELRRIFGLPC